ncbi:MAG: hypothetical protein LUE12_06130 [Ruminococcus sp.]|nr:hypothetical protein [Ruminococcus sp.]
MKTFKEKVTKYLKPVVLLILIILLQSIYTVYFFINVKNGFHSDEMWSYGLSNSYYLPSVYVEGDINYNNKKVNFNEWISGEFFNDYLTVQEGEQFSYASVYYNQTQDRHPPLYYFLLHTVCSFFPDSFSFYFGLFLNLIFLALTQVFLYKLSKILLKQKYIALIPCVLYGAGTGALSTFIFIRQYALVAALLTMYTYFNAKLFTSDDFDLKKCLPPILITSFLTFLSLYAAIAYIAIFTLCFCIYFIFKKKIRKMFIYGLSELATLFLFIAVFPSVIQQLFYNASGYNQTVNFWFWFKRMLNYITAYNFGIHVSAFKNSAYSYVLAAIVIILAVAIPLCFLFRKEEWFLRFKNKAKELMKNTFKRLFVWIKSANYIPAFVAFTTIVVTMLLYFIVELSDMGIYRIRYVFMLYPMACTAAMSLIISVIGVIPKIKNFKAYIALLLTVVMSVNVNLNYPSPFIYNSSKNINYLDNDLFEGKTCLVIFAEEDEFTAYTNLTYFLKDTDYVFATYGEALEEQMEQIESFEKDVDCVVLLSSNYNFTSEQLEEYNALAGTVTEIEDESDEEGKIDVDDDVAKLFVKDYTDCTDLVDSLSPTDGWSISAMLELNGGYYYVLE